LTQVQDCHGNVLTPRENGTAGWMFALAVIGILPLLWRVRSLRQPIVLVTGVATACVLIMSVLGIPVLIVLALTRSMSDEEAVALCCFTLVLAFVLVFPIAMMLGNWLGGASLTWAASWLELFGMIWWAVAAADR
jgi:hypothetical protein